MKQKKQQQQQKKQSRSMRPIGHTMVTMVETVPSKRSKRLACVTTWNNPPVTTCIELAGCRADNPPPMLLCTMEMEMELSCDSSFDSSCDSSCDSCTIDEGELGVRRATSTPPALYNEELLIPVEALPVVWHDAERV